MSFEKLKEQEQESEDLVHTGWAVDSQLLQKQSIFKVFCQYIIVT